MMREANPRSYTNCRFNRFFHFALDCTISSSSFESNLIRLDCRNICEGTGKQHDDWLVVSAIRQSDKRSSRLISLVLRGLYSIFFSSFRAILQISSRRNLATASSLIHIVKRILLILWSWTGLNFPSTTTDELDTFFLLNLLSWLCGRVLRSQVPSSPFVIMSIFRHNQSTNECRFFCPCRISKTSLDYSYHRQSFSRR
jgi:hypothetical protein